MNGLKRLRRPEDIARQRGKTIREVLPLPRNYQVPRRGRRACRRVAAEDEA